MPSLPMPQPSPLYLLFSNWRHAHRALSLLQHLLDEGGEWLLLACWTQPLRALLTGMCSHKHK